MSVGRDQSEAYRAYEEAINLVTVDPNGLYTSHTSVRRKTENSFG